MDLLYERFRTDLALALERSVATAADLTRLEAANAAEHAGIARLLDDHETRLRTLERD
jgi:hypothetical protein